MARLRKIDPDDILDAAVRVLARLGVAGFSIDSVAREAGISKSRVVYDHKSKAGLLEALMLRELSEYEKGVEAAVAACADTPHAELFGRIRLFADEVPDDTDKAVTLALSAGMSCEERLRDHLRDTFAHDLCAIGRTERPQAALMAYLALHGFVFFELFDFFRWNEETRRRILQGIETIFLSHPEDGAGAGNTQ